MEVSYFGSSIIESGIKSGFSFTDVLLFAFGACDEVYYPGGFASDV